jgi:hypothetical protein
VFLEPLAVNWPFRVSFVLSLRFVSLHVQNYVSMAPLRGRGGRGAALEIAAVLEPTNARGGRAGRGGRGGRGGGVAEVVVDPPLPVVPDRVAAAALTPIANAARAENLARQGGVPNVLVPQEAVAGSRAASVVRDPDAGGRAASNPQDLMVGSRAASIVLVRSDASARGVSSRARSGQGGGGGGGDDDSDSSSSADRGPRHNHRQRRGERAIDLAAINVLDAAGRADALRQASEAGRLQRALEPVVFHRVVDADGILGEAFGDYAAVAYAFLESQPGATTAAWDRERRVERVDHTFAVTHLRNLQLQMALGAPGAREQLLEGLANGEARLTGKRLASLQVDLRGVALVVLEHGLFTHHARSEGTVYSVGQAWHGDSVKVITHTVRLAVDHLRIVGSSATISLADRAACLRAKDSTDKVKEEASLTTVLAQSSAAIAATGLVALSGPAVPASPAATLSTAAAAAAAAAHTQQLEDKLEESKLSIRGLQAKVDRLTAIIDAPVEAPPTTHPNAATGYSRGTRAGTPRPKFEKPNNGNGGGNAGNGGGGGAGGYGNGGGKGKGNNNNNGNGNNNNNGNGNAYRRPR